MNAQLTFDAPLENEHRRITRVGIKLLAEVSALGVKRPNTGKGLARPHRSLTGQMPRLDSPRPAIGVTFSARLAVIRHG